ncbi:MAG: hypothetical protein JO326_08215 [Acetobacteraceae bacterium]|nr:hypothetical protein [Acetobacteraceae bacterium]
MLGLEGEAVLAAGFEDALVLSHSVRDWDGDRRGGRGCARRLGAVFPEARETLGAAG